MSGKRHRAIFCQTKKLPEVEGRAMSSAFPKLVSHPVCDMTCFESGAPAIAIPGESASGIHGRHRLMPGCLRRRVSPPPSGTPARRGITYAPAGNGENPNYFRQNPPGKDLGIIRSPKTRLPWQAGIRRRTILVRGPCYPLLQRPSCADKKNWKGRYFTGLFFPPPASLTSAPGR